MQRIVRIPQNKKVGIVIPIYNVAPYIRECLDSVINQTYNNLSIVLVNDGSTDNGASLDIAKEYVAKDSRFILIDKENGGQSTARNVGIAWFSEKYKTKLDAVVSLESSITNNEQKDKNDINSTECNTQFQSVENLDSRIKETKLYTYDVSNENPYNIHKIYSNSINENNTLQPQKIDYIIFLDSDDYWHPCCIEECIRNSDGVEIVWFNLKFFADGVKFKSNWSLMYLTKLSRGKISSSDWLYACVANKVDAFPFVVQGIIDFNYLKRINHYFYDKVYAEDHLFGVLLFLQSNFIYVIPEPFYIYRIRPNSSCDFDKKNIHIPKHFEETAKMFKNRKAAKKYYIGSSWFFIFNKFLEFLDKNPQYRNRGVEEALLPFYAHQCLRILECTTDPFNLAPKIESVRPYLKKDYKYRHRLLLKNPKRYNLLEPFFKLYDYTKMIEIKTRRGIKTVMREYFVEIQTAYKILQDMVLWYIFIKCVL